MAQELYALLTPTAFRLPTNPSPNAVYVQAIINPGDMPDPAPLTHMEQATINTTFTHCKHCFLSMRNIEHACFTTLDLSINNKFKVSDDPAIQGWHARISCIFILDQLLELYCHPTQAILEQNDKVFCSPYLAANAPKFLFLRIKDCAEIALLGQDLYTCCQLINNAIRLLLTTGLYLYPFEEWDCLLPAGQIWIMLHTMIQESFQ
jgi:hypothetical protein